MSLQKLHKNVLPQPSFKLLSELCEIRKLKDFYLVGGTALALYLGHRESVDLDFFSDQEFSSNIVKQLERKNEILILNNNSVELIIDRTKVLFFYFAFPLTKELQVIEGIRLADPVDIGLMKLLAIQGRSTKKDIIDLYFIDQKVIELTQLLELFEVTYPKEMFNSYDSYKNLLDQASFDIQPMPKMFAQVDWNECLEVVSSKIIRFVEKRLD